MSTYQEWHTRTFPCGDLPDELQQFLNVYTADAYKAGWEAALQSQNLPHVELDVQFFKVSPTP